MSPLLKQLSLAAVALSGCTAPQLQTASGDVAAVTAALNKGCQTYAGVQAAVNLTPVGTLPQAQVIEGFASGACVGAQATSTLVSKALADPSTQIWLENLSSQLKALHL